MLELGDGDLTDRHNRVKATIERTADLHAGIDVGIGLGGVLLGAFVPGGGLAATIAAVLAQVPIYQGMAEELSAIYETPQDIHVRRVLFSGMTLDSAMTAGSDVLVHSSTQYLVDQFSSGFLKEIAWEIAGENAPGVALVFLPLLGGVAAMGLDVIIAVKMTWRVGLMISAYHQNGRRFPGGSRRATYESIKHLPSGSDPSIIPDEIPEVFETLVQQTMVYIQESLLAIHPSASRHLIREHLKTRKFPEKIAEEAIRRVMGDE